MSILVRMKFNAEDNSFTLPTYHDEQGNTIAGRKFTKEDVSRAQELRRGYMHSLIKAEKAREAWEAAATWTTGSLIGAFVYRPICLFTIPLAVLAAASIVNTQISMADKVQKLEYLQMKYLGTDENMTLEEATKSALEFMALSGF